MTGVWQPDTAPVDLRVVHDGTAVDFTAASSVVLLVERDGGGAATSIPCLVDGWRLTVPGGVLAEGAYRSWVVATVNGATRTYPSSDRGPARLIVRARPAVA